MTHLAYGRTGLAPVLALAISGALACTAGVRPSATGTGGSTSTGAGGSGATGGMTSGTGGSGTSTGGIRFNTGGDVGIGGAAPNPDAAACQQMEIPFKQTNPTVYLLVDRSGSMFHCLTGATGDAVCSDPTNTSWTHLKTAIEQVLPTLDSQVRFGFTTVWGTNPMGGGMCPSLQGMLTDNVSPALNNAAAIKTKYDSLAFPPNSTQMGVKFESPASESLDNVTKALMADTTTGSKYIIFITDGQPDYCDDSNSLCAPDSVIWKLQEAYTAGIKTIVMGIQTSLFDLAPGVLQSWANAGAGEPTIPPVKTGGTTFDFYDQCGQNIVTGWSADLTASGQTAMRGDTLGMYSTTSGPTMPYQPNAADTTALTTALTSALSGVRSCTFDLSSFQIYTDDLSGAIVYLTDTSGKQINLPLDTKDQNGWDMIDATPVTVNGMTKHIATQLQLFGTACTELQAATTTGIKFNFPCDVFIMIN